MPDLSASLLTILDELAARLGLGETLSEVLLEELRVAWSAERPGDQRGLEVLLNTLLARPSTTLPPLSSAPVTAGGGVPSRTDNSTGTEQADASPDEYDDVAFAAESIATEGWIYPVFFCTNREPVNSRDGSRGFLARRSNTLTRGRCDVWLPKARHFGELGTPWWKRWPRFQFKDDHARLQQTLLLQPAEFNVQLREAVVGGAGNHALIFIHGYCTSFEDAALRAAQLGFDLQVSGATAFFAWPSQGKLTGYPADGASIEASEAAISNFLVEFAAESGAHTVHVVAHSMGNRGLLRALQRLTNDAAAQTNVHFGQLFLAAPDIDRDLFLGLADLYSRFADRTTMYASAKDRALQTSSWLHGYPRAGYLPPTTVVPPEHRIDTIAIPDLDIDSLGHSSFAGDAILQDMFELMRHGTPPQERQRLVEGRGWWEFRS